QVQCRVRLGVLCLAAHGCPQHATLRLWLCSLLPLPPPAQMACTRLLDHLICQEEQRWGYCDPERLGGLHVDDELELHRLLHRQVGGLGSLQNLIDVCSGAQGYITLALPIGHEQATLGKLSRPLNSRQPTREGQGREPPEMLKVEGRSENDEGLGLPCVHGGERALEVVGTVHRDRLHLYARRA